MKNQKRSQKKVNMLFGILKLLPTIALLAGVVFVIIYNIAKGIFEIFMKMKKRINIKKIEAQK